MRRSYLPVYGDAPPPESVTVHRPMVRHTSDRRRNTLDAVCISSAVSSPMTTRSRLAWSPLSSASAAHASGVAVSTRCRRSRVHLHAIEEDRDPPASAPDD